MYIYPQSFAPRKNTGNISMTIAEFRDFKEILNSHEEMIVRVIYNQRWNQPNFFKIRNNVSCRIICRGDTDIVLVPLGSQIIMKTTVLENLYNAQRSYLTKSVHAYEALLKMERARKIAFKEPIYCAPAAHYN